MKTMTCEEMGGTCDVAMTASTEKEMTDAGWKHLEEAHPEAAKEMAALPQEDKDKWAADFHAKWEAKPENEGSEEVTEEEEEDEAPVVSDDEEEAV